MTAREVSAQIGEDLPTVIRALKVMHNVVRPKERPDTGQTLFRSMTARDFFIRGLMGW